MKEIVITRSTKGFMAHSYVDDHPDPQVISLFGTHILPTPFTLQANPHMVIAKIKALNPGVRVTLA